jgi:predicted transcriptional regulator
MNKVLAHIVKQASKWPEERQEQLAHAVADIAEEMKSNVYYPTRAELEGIDRGLAASKAGKIVSKKKMDALFARFRKA